jgi:DNA-binding transcriptional MocR family regulator
VNVREDSGVSLWLARAVAQYIADGKLCSQLDRVRSAGKRRRDYALNALRQYCGTWADSFVPPGGAYLWLELSPRVDWQRVRSRLAREGLLCHPAERVAGASDAKQFLRFGFLQAPDAELDRWFNALGRAIAANVAH